MINLADNDVMLSVGILRFTLPLCKLNKNKCYEESGLYYSANS